MGMPVEIRGRFSQQKRLLDGLPRPTRPVDPKLTVPANRGLYHFGRLVQYDPKFPFQWDCLSPRSFSSPSDIPASLHWPRHNVLAAACHIQS